MISHDMSRIDMMDFAFECKGHANIRVLFYSAGACEYRVYSYDTPDTRYVMYVNFELQTTRLESESNELTLGAKQEILFKIDSALNISPEEFVNKIPTWLLFL